MMEGLSNEAASLPVTLSSATSAGIYDSNRITIEAHEHRFSRRHRVAVLVLWLERRARGRRQPISIDWTVR